MPTESKVCKGGVRCLHLHRVVTFLGDDIRLVYHSLSYPGTYRTCRVLRGAKSDGTPESAWVQLFPVGS